MENDRLVEELRSERIALFELLATVSPESMTTPGLLGEWSGRDLIAHLGYWAGHAAELIHEVEQGRVDEVGAGQPSVDEINQTVTRIAGQTSLATVRRREAGSVDALVARLESLDPALLEVVLPDGATLAQGIREDGAEHYQEHADELREVLTEGARG
jgi:hypothetical protein